MPDCATCNRPLTRHRLRCKVCGRCAICCVCAEEGDDARFDRDELGLDPEEDL